MSTKFNTGSVLEFITMGCGKHVYMRKMDSSDAKRCVPMLGGIPDGVEVYIAFHPNGLPFAVTDSRAMTIASVVEDELEIASVH